MSITFDVDPRLKSNAAFHSPRQLEPLSKWLLLMFKKAEAWGGTENIVMEGSAAAHGFIQASNHAYDTHLPLTLSPDHVWLTIAMGFSKFIELNPKEGIAKFFNEGEIKVSDDGKIEKKLIRIRRDDFRKGSRDNDWVWVFGRFEEEIRKLVRPKVCDHLLSDFSTTGPLERAVSQIVLMDTMKEFIEYRMSTCCGLSKVTLLGTVEDWKEIRAKVSVFAEFGLSWWTDQLMPVLTEFIHAAEGSPDIGWWKNYFKEHSGSGTSTITGHINAFFPYLRQQYSRPVKKIVFVPRTEAPQGWAKMESKEVPKGYCTVPFLWEYLEQLIPMEFVGGMPFMTYDQDGSVMPALCWVVQESGVP